MSLSFALTNARSSLTATGVQSSVVARNIAGAQEGGSSRKSAVLATIAGGGVYVASIQRAEDKALFANLITATSSSAKQNVVYNAVQELSSATIDDTELDQSPAAKLSALRTALDQYANAPYDVTLGQSLVTAAINMANALNDATSTTQELRQKADADMEESVDKINSLLEKLESVNTAIVKGTVKGDDVTDYLDMRDSILSDLSQQIGITASTRENNDIVVYTDSGVTLFETSARSVTFDRTHAYDATISGNAVYVDGVPVTGASAVMPIKSGNLAGLAEVRDEVAVTYQSQLDEIARGLVEVFAESDQSVTPTLPDVPGLFTYAGAPAMPVTGVVNTGLAGTIRVNAAVDPDQGGDPKRIRDGAINGNPAYTYNTTGADGFFTRLKALSQELSADMTFDASTLASPNGTLIEYAGSSASWLNARLASAHADSTYQTTVVERTAEALSNVNGINMDDEMVVMLQIERTFAASSKVIASIDSMLQSLLDAVR
jgi:flagellar hook-associated protein 1 FlgK